MAFKPVACGHLQHLQVDFLAFLQEYLNNLLIFRTKKICSRRQLNSQIRRAWQLGQSNSAAVDGPVVPHRICKSKDCDGSWSFACDWSRLNEFQCFSVQDNIAVQICGKF